MKTITINGVSIEATKEDLEKALKEFDKPVGTIKFRDGNNEYGLYKNGKAEIDIGNTELPFQENNSQLIYTIANAMGVLASKEEILNCDICKYGVNFSSYEKKFVYVYSYSGLSGTSLKEDNGIVELLNNSVLMKEFE